MILKNSNTILQSDSSTILNGSDDVISILGASNVLFSFSEFQSTTKTTGDNLLTNLFLSLSNLVSLGSASVVAGGTTITGTGFTSALVGRLIMIGSDFRFVKTFTSATSLEIDSTWMNQGGFSTTTTTTLFQVGLASTNGLKNFSGANNMNQIGTPVTSYVTKDSNNKIGFVGSNLQSNIATSGLTKGTIALCHKVVAVPIGIGTGIASVGYASNSIGMPAGAGVSVSTSSGFYRIRWSAGSSNSTFPIALGNTDIVILTFTGTNATLYVNGQSVSTAGMTSANLSTEGLNLSAEWSNAGRVPGWFMETKEAYFSNQNITAVQANDIYTKLKYKYKI